MVGGTYKEGALPPSPIPGPSSGEFSTAPANRACSAFSLLSSSASISEICSLVGFNDQSYYCKVFKRLSGVTPDRFRKRSRRIDTEKEYALK